MKKREHRVDQLYSIFIEIDGMVGEEEFLISLLFFLKIRILITYRKCNDNFNFAIFRVVYPNFSSRFMQILCKICNEIFIRRFFFFFPPPSMKK